MNLELENKLCEEFPNLYKDRYKSPLDTCMCWGFCVGDGWYDIIYDLSKVLERNSIVAVQVKEKFGGLRFYYQSEKKRTLLEWFEWKVLASLMVNKYWKGGIQWNKIIDFRKKYLFKSSREKIDDLVAHTEELSYKICEKCGQPGELRSDRGWMVTLCDKCEELSP